MKSYLIPLGIDLFSLSGMLAPLYVNDAFTASGPQE